MLGVVESGAFSVSDSGVVSVLRENKTEKPTVDRWITVGFDMRAIRDIDTLRGGNLQGRGYLFGML